MEELLGNSDGREESTNRVSKILTWYMELRLAGKAGDGAQQFSHYSDTEARPLVALSIDCLSVISWCCFVDRNLHCHMCLD